MRMGRRQALKAGVGVIAAAGGLGVPAIGRAQAATKLPLATVWPDGNFHTINCRRFAEEVKKRPTGRSTST